MIERALFIESSKALKKCVSSGEYSRIYFGEEFCARRIPDVRDIDTVMNCCLKKGLHFTFLTPPTAGSELLSVSHILERVNSVSLRFPEVKTEIVINDWGIYNILENCSGMAKVMGRFLVRQKCDPGYIKLSNDKIAHLMPEDIGHIRSCNIDSNRYMIDFCKENFSRIELSNAIQGIDLTSPLPKSLILPLVPVSLTRYCKLAAIGNNERNASNYYKCYKSCRKIYGTFLKGDIIIYVYGNAQFYLNTQTPSLNKLEKLNVDRIVEYNFSLLSG